MLAGSGRGWEKEFETVKFTSLHWQVRAVNWIEDTDEVEMLRLRDFESHRACEAGQELQWGDGESEMLRVHPSYPRGKQEHGGLRSPPGWEQRLKEEIWRICTLEEMWLTSEEGKGRVIQPGMPKGDVEQEMLGATGEPDDCGLLPYALVCWQFFPSRTKVACPRLEWNLALELSPSATLSCSILCPLSPSCF